MKTNKNLCSQGDGRKAYCKGFCELHYKRWQRKRPLERPVNREVVDGDVKVSSRVGPAAAQVIERACKQLKVRPYTLIRDVLENWAQGKYVLRDAS